MKRKELQQFSKEVLAAAIVGLSVAGTTVSVEAADQDDAQTMTTAESAVNEQNRMKQAEDVADTVDEIINEEVGTTDIENEQNQEETTNEVEQINSEIDNDDKVANELVEEAENTEENTAENQEKNNSSETGENEESKTITEDEDNLETKDASSEEQKENQNNGWVQEGDDRYYYDDNGVKATGITEIDGIKYYFDEESGKLNTDCKFIQSGYYYEIGSEGIVIYEQQLPENGTFDTGDGDIYYVENGEIVRNQFVQTGYGEYYFGDDGKAVKNQFVQVGDYKYYLDYDGQVVKNQQIYDEQLHIYQLDEDGHVVYGWYRNGNLYYYYDLETGQGYDYGLYEIDGKQYFFEYRAVTNDVRYVNGVFYYFGDDGSAQEKTEAKQDGWIQVKDNWYYIKDGGCVTGWLSLENKKYYFDSNGKMIVNREYNTGYPTDTGKAPCYRFDKTGAMVTGWYTDDEGNKYYYDEDGLAASGFLNIGGNTYYFSDYGKMATSTVVSENGVLYKIDSDGKAEIIQQEGIINAGKNTYYIKNGEVYKDQFITSAGWTYYLDYYGRAVKNATTIVYDTETGRYYEYRFDEEGHMLYGWQERYGQKSYYDKETGRAYQDGLYEIDGKKYYFESYMIQNASRFIDGYLYYFGNDGSAEKQTEVKNDGWVQMPNGWYYVQNYNILKNEWLTLGENKYYFGFDGVMYSNRVEGVYDNQSGEYIYYWFGTDGNLQKGWYVDKYSNQKRYFGEDGCAVKGYQKIEGEYYFFNEYDGCLEQNVSKLIDGELIYFGTDGKVKDKIVVSQDGWYELSGAWYVIKNGQLAKDQWIQNNGNKYYFDSNGNMMRETTGWLYDSSGNQSVYSFDENGIMRTGWYNEYYFDKSGRAVKGYQNIDGNLYYFDENYQLVKDGSIVIDGELSYFDSFGKLVKKEAIIENGWMLMPDGWYYAQDYRILEWQWITIANKKYYLGNHGLMYANRVEEIYDNTSGRYVYFWFDTDGTLRTGWYINSGNDQKYFGVDGKAVKGYQKIDGEYYFFNEYSANLEKDICEIVNNQLIYFGTDGKQIEQKEITQDGWYKLNEYWYYIKNKEILKDEVLQLGTKKYYLDYEGKMIRNQMRGLDQNMTGKYTWYYFDNDGSAHIGWKYNYGSKYYFLEDGSAAQGIVEIDGIWYGFGEQGYLVYERCIEQEGKLYYCSSSGIANVEKSVDLTNNGWKKMPNGWYFSKDGHILKEQWLQLPSGWYYLDYDGKMYQDIYTYINGKNYRFDHNGNMVTGMYIDDSGYKYYYNADGTAAGGLIEYNGKLYYADISQEGRITSNQIIYANGKLYSTDVYGVCTQVEGTGWICGTYYIMNGKACLGWKYINENWYYFDLDNASKYSNTIRTINEVDYSFDSTGALETGWIKNSDGGYYFANSSGALIKDKWMQLSDTWYYFKDKLMATGLIQIDGKNQLFNNNGAWIGEWENNSSTGWKQSGSDWYYVEKGNIVVNTIKSIGNALYYFDEYGKMLANQRYNGYYLTSSGAALQSKWLQDATGQRIYFGSDGKNIINGWKQIGASKYYFCNGAAVMNNTVIDGVLYYFNSDGIYLEKSEILSNGWKLINGDYYYFENGDMVRNRLMVINGRKYAFDGAGRMIIEGFYQENINSDLYYFNKYGEVASNGWQNNNTIYVGADGKVLKGLQTINGKQYYFSYDGNGVYIHAKTSDCVSSDGKQIYVINEKTHEIQDIINISGTRWYKTSNGKWFYAKDGKLAEAGHSYIINGARYMFDENGAMWENEDVFSKLLLMTIDIEGYANSTGVITSNGWCGDVYYLNGKFMTGAHVIDGKYYYFINAKKASGIYFVDGNYYRYDTDGNRNIVSLKNGWVKESGNWYYVENGVIQRNCEKYINGAEYQFDGFGRLVCNSWQYAYENNDYIGRRVYLDENGFLTKGWKTIDGKTYYFDQIGRAVTGKQTIDGKTYYFNSEGAMI